MSDEMLAQGTVDFRREEREHDLGRWAYEQQKVAEVSVEHNKTAVLGDACVRCGRKDELFNYRFGRKDQPVCRDRDACDRAANA